MTAFSASPTELTCAASAAHQAAAELRGELERLHRRACEVVEGQWSGRAAEAFERAWLRWHHAATEAVQALDVLADDLGACSTGYADADRTGAGALSAAGAR